MLPHTGQRRDTECKRGAHRVELRGVLPPWVLDRLYGVLETAQGGELQVLRALGIINLRYILTSPLHGMLSWVLLSMLMCICMSLP